MITQFSRLVRGLDARQNKRLPDLGERELLVLEVLWEGAGSTAQAVHSKMPDKAISLSTVQSTLERLYRKRLVDRTKEGRSYRYQAAMERSQLISALLRNMAHHVSAGDLAPMISGFLNYVAEEAPELLGDLSRSLGIEPKSENEPPGHDDD
tara:strand:- start:379033 stop:379488 length:456 start_codon:yes stop_codon:yes gene_type:complete